MGLSSVWANAQTDGKPHITTVDSRCQILILGMKLIIEVKGNGLVGDWDTF
jgi:hypothetical protein